MVNLGDSSDEVTLEPLDHVDLPGWPGLVQGTGKDVGDVVGELGVGPWRGKGAAANVALELRRFLHPTRVIQPRWHLEEPPSERHEAIQAAADDPTKRLVRRRRPGGGRGWVQTATAPTWNRLVGDSRDTNSEPMPLSHFMGDLPSPERTVSGRRQGPIMGDQAIDRTPDPTQKSPNTSASEMAP